MRYDDHWFATKLKKEIQSLYGVSLEKRTDEHVLALARRIMTPEAYDASYERVQEFRRREEKRLEQDVYRRTYARV